MTLNEASVVNCLSVLLENQLKLVANSYLYSVFASCFFIWLCLFTLQYFELSGPLERIIKWRKISSVNVTFWCQCENQTISASFKRCHFVPVMHVGEFKTLDYETVPWTDGKWQSNDIGYQRGSGYGFSATFTCEAFNAVRCLYPPGVQQGICLCLLARPFEICTANGKNSCRLQRVQIRTPWLTPVIRLTVLTETEH